MTARSRPPTAPRHLHDAGKALWRGVLADYEVTDTHDLARLQAAAEAADRITQAREAVERDGAYVEGRFGMKAHPALAIERDARTQLLRALRELGVDLAQAAPTRPPSRWRGT